MWHSTQMNMKISIKGFGLSLIVLAVLIEPLKTSENETSVKGRRSRVNGRIVKLYSGPKPNPILCTEEGFKADPIHCAVFYRCLKSSSGKFTVFKFQCGPGTVYDPEIEVCNHPSNTKRSECGGLVLPAEQDVENDIELHELPSPISTILPIPSSQHDTDKFPVLENVLTSPAEQGYEHLLSSSSTPYSLRTTTKKVQDHNQVSYPWIVYNNRSEENTSSNTGSPNLDKRDVCTSDGFVGDSEDCKKFYRCVSNSRGGFIHYEFLCSNLTVWDDSIQSCNHPWAVRNRRCGTIHNEVESFSNNNNILKDLPNNAYLPEQDSQDTTIINNYPNNYENKLQYHLNAFNTENTHKQYESHVHSSITTSKINYIGSGESFNDNENVRDFDKITSTLATYSSKKDSENRAKELNKVRRNFICTRNGFVGDGNDCSKFYRCVDNGKGSYTKYEFSCSQGTVWDKKLKVCNYAWAVKECGAETTSRSTTIFNENDHGYMHQINSQSLATVTVTTPVLLISTTEASKTLETGCTETKFIGDASDCKKFYKCIDNGRGNFTKYEYKCGDGTLWDQNIEACNHELAVKSCNSISPSTTSHIMEANTGHTSAANLLIESTTSNILQSYNNNYNTFYGFQQGETTQKIQSTLSHIGQEAKCQTTGFVGDIADCKKFYRCVINKQGNYIRYEFSCGEGTFWDPEIEACNHAWAVKKCGTGKSFKNEVTSSQINLDSNAYQTINADNDNVITTMSSSIDTNKPEKVIGDYDSGYALQQSVTTKKPHIDVQTTTLKDKLEKKMYCQTPGFIGDNNNCNKFYRCVDNGNGGFIQHEFLCGEGTVWDPEIESCNHAWAVKQCGGGMESDGNGATTPITTSITNMNVAESNNEYITPNYVDVDNTPSKNSQTTSISSANINSECKVNGFIRDKSDCKKFYRCVDTGNGTFIKYNFSCGEGTAWDSQINACSHVGTVKDCKNSSTEIFETTTSTTNNNKESIDNNFTSSIKNDNNFTESTTPYSSTSMLIKDNNSNKCQSSGFIGDSNSCEKFYRCVEDGNGGFIRFEFLCGEGTVWDSNINSCNHRNSVVKCGGNYSNEFVKTTTQNLHTTSSITHSDSLTTPSSNYSNSSTQPSTSITRSPYDDIECKTEGFFADPNDCKKFYRCVKNDGHQFTKYNFSCANGTIWIQEMQACDYDMDEAHCTTSFGSATTDSTTIFIPTEIPNTSNLSNVNSPTHNISENVDIDECTSEGFYASKNNCQNFYRCVDNDGSYTKYVFSCAQGTAWDAAIQSCNYINEVKNCYSSAHPVNNTGVKPVENEQTTEYYTTNSTSASTVYNPISTVGNRCTQEGYFGDSHNCQKFYRCVIENDKKYTKYDYTCGEGTIWDSDIDACNHPYDVKKPSCKSEHETSSSVSTIPTVSVSSTTSEVITTNAPPSVSSEIPSNNNNVTHLNCSNNISDGNSDSKNFICSKAGFYADHRNCKMFYRCVDWGNDGKKFSVYHFECGDGTIWDPALETCNHEDSVYPPRNCNGTQQSGNTSETQTTTVEIITTTNEADTSNTSFETTKVSQQTTTQSLSSNNPSTESSKTDTPTTQFPATEAPTTNKETTMQISTTIGTTTSKEPTTQLTTIIETTIASSTTEMSTTSSTTQVSTILSTTEVSTTPPTTEVSTTPSTTEMSTTSSTTQVSTILSTTEVSTTLPTTEVSTTPSTTEMSTTPPTTVVSTASSTTTVEESTANEQFPSQSTQVVTDHMTTQVDHEQTTKLSTLQTTVEHSTTLESSTSSTQATSITPDTTTSEQGITGQSTNETPLQTTDSQSTAAEISTSSTTEISTETNSSNIQKCPDTDGDQSIYICPTSFKRHPKYCNLFYQCIEDNDTHEIKIATFNCPNNTIYDENKIQCVEEGKSSEKCRTKTSQKHRVKRLGAAYNDPIVVSNESMACLRPGHFPFEKYTECSTVLLKCELTDSGKLRGYVYRCPEGFVYWNISRRCEAIENVRDCKRSFYPWKRRYDIPLERSNISL